MAVEPVKIPARPPALPPSALTMAQYQRGHYFCIVPIETTLEQLLTPAYWQNHIQILGGPGAKPFPIIEVMRADGSLEVWLRVLQTKPGMAIVRPIFPAIVVGVDGQRLAAAEAFKAGDAKVELPPGYKHAHVPQGANKGHMLRLPNSEVLVQGEPTKAAAAVKGWTHYRQSMGLPAGTGPLTPEEQAAVDAKVAQAS